MRLSVVTFREQMAEPINLVAYGGERVVLERRGKGVAALVSMKDLATLEALEDAADLKAARRARKERGSVSLDQIKARIASAKPKPHRRKG